jgi:hypothetical protein
VSEAKTCLNCKTALPEGAKFCYNCGQENRDLQIRFWELLSEFLSNTFNFDARLGRTIIDLVKRPGEITKQFHEGKRARYVRPMQLYLFVSFVYFLLSSMSPTTIVNQFPESEAEAGLMVDNGLIKVNVDSNDIFLLGQNLKKTDPNDEAAIDSLLDLTGETEHSDWERHLMKQTVRALNPKYEEVLKQEVFANLSWAMFLLLPVFASMLWFIVRKVSPFYIDSLIFSIHFHTVVFILFSIGAIIDFFVSSDLVYQTIIVLTVLYLLLSLKRVYVLKWKKAISRTIGLGFSYAIIFGLSYLVILGISFWLY